jgi:hypothetical protein
LENIYYLYLKKRAESFRLKRSDLASQLHDHQDEIYAGITMFYNKYIRQNIVSRFLKLVIKGKKQFFQAGELLFFAEKCIKTQLDFRICLILIKDFKGELLYGRD